MPTSTETAGNALLEVMEHWLNRCENNITSHCGQFVTPHWLWKNLGATVSVGNSQVLLPSLDELIAWRSQISYRREEAYRQFKEHLESQYLLVNWRGFVRFVEDHEKQPNSQLEPISLLDELRQIMALELLEWNLNMAKLTQIRTSPTADGLENAKALFRQVPFLEAIARCQRFLGEWLRVIDMYHWTDKILPGDIIRAQFLPESELVYYHPPGTQALQDQFALELPSQYKPDEKCIDPSDRRVIPQRLDAYRDLGCAAACEPPSWFNINGYVAITLPPTANGGTILVLETNQSRCQYLACFGREGKMFRPFCHWPNWPEMLKDFVEHNCF